MNTWLFIGVGLVIWVLYDLFNGVTWTYRAIYRKYEPQLYWIVTSIWIIIALTALFAG